MSCAKWLTKNFSPTPWVISLDSDGTLTAKNAGFSQSNSQTCFTAKERLGITPRYFICVSLALSVILLSLPHSFARSLSMFLVPVGATDSLLLVWLMTIPADGVFAKHTIWPCQVYSVSPQLLDLGRVQVAGCRSQVSIVILNIMNVVLYMCPINIYSPFCTKSLFNLIIWSIAFLWLMSFERWTVD